MDMSDRTKTFAEPSAIASVASEATGRNLSSFARSDSENICAGIRSGSNNNKLIDTSEQLRNITESTDYLSTELNNNSILAPGGTSYAFASKSPHTRMDPKRKALATMTAITTAPITNSSSAITIDSTATKVSLERSIERSIKSNQETTTNQIPSYSSIFTSSSYRRSMSPPTNIQQQQSTTKSTTANSGSNRGTSVQNNKQFVESEIEIPVTISRLANINRKLPIFSHSSPKDSSHESHQQQDDEGSDENDFDERHPFSSSMTKSATNSMIKSNKRISPDSHRCSSPCKHPLPACGHRCDASGIHNNNNKHVPHTKISFNESRPSSFNLCRSNDYDSHEAYNRKADWQDLPMCFKCDCADCYKKRELFMRSEHHREPNNSSTTYIETKHSRTGSVHLILKSVILILLTLLLLIILVGIILACHYLPQVFDRLLSASRSFNVTIAG